MWLVNGGTDPVRLFLEIFKHALPILAYYTRSQGQKTNLFCLSILSFLRNKMNRRTTTRSSGASTVASDGRPKSKVDAEKGMWSSMLNRVASGRKLPEMNLIVLGSWRESLH